MSVLPAYILSEGVPILTKYVVAAREITDVCACEFVYHAGEIVGVLL